VSIGAEALFIVTAYAAGCGGSGLTKHGERVPAADRTVAMDPRVAPKYAPLAIEGVGVRYNEDTGRLIKGNRIDVFMGSCKAAREFGVKRLYVMRLP
jgi:3D (Asp-Asp-Asp) domain-containing protein